MIVNKMSLFKTIFKHLIIACFLGLIMIGCSNQDIQEELESNIILPPQNQEIWEGEIVYFEGIASGGAPPYTYHWNFGVGIPPSSKRKPGKIVFSYEEAHKVLFTVKDSKNNTNTDFVRIIVKRKEMF